MSVFIQNEYYYLLGQYLIVMDKLSCFDSSEKVSTHNSFGAKKCVLFFVIFILTKYRLEGCLYVKLID